MKNNTAYGVDFDFTTGTAQRLGASAGKTPGADFDAVRMYGGRKRCNLTDDGTVVAYYGDEGYSESGTLRTPIVKDGKTYPALNTTSYTPALMKPVSTTRKRQLIITRMRVFSRPTQAQC